MKYIYVNCISPWRKLLLHLSLGLLYRIVKLLGTDWDALFFWLCLTQCLSGRHFVQKLAVTFYRRRCTNQHQDTHLLLWRPGRFSRPLLVSKLCSLSLFFYTFVSLLFVIFIIFPFPGLTRASGTAPPAGGTVSSTNTVRPGERTMYRWRASRRGWLLVCYWDNRRVAAPTSTSFFV